MSIRFGPAGNSESFYAQGYKASWQAPKWLHDMGLSAYEYSLGRGINLSDEMAGKIRLEAEKWDVAVSVHAPYYINLANPDPEKREASLRYILESARLVALLGGDRVVVHAGAEMKMERAEAFQNCRAGILDAYRRMDGLGLSHVHLCPETMGRPSQIGNLSETLELCQADDRLLPCVDFAHLHALGQGALRETADFARVLDAAEAALGIERARRMHVHFSAIEFTAAGEKRHRTFAEADYGPRFQFLAPLLKERGYAPRIICECKGTMAEDAREMLRLYGAV